MISAVRWSSRCFIGLLFCDLEPMKEVYWTLWWISCGAAEVCHSDPFVKLQAERRLRVERGGQSLVLWSLVNGPNDPKHGFQNPPCFGACEPVRRILMFVWCFGALWLQQRSSGVETNHCQHHGPILQIHNYIQNQIVQIDFRMILASISASTLQYFGRLSLEEVERQLCSSVWAWDAKGRKGCDANSLELQVAHSRS